MISFALNPIILYLVPDADAKLFYSTYAAASSIGGLLFTFLFSQKRLKVNYNIVYAVLIFCILVSVKINSLFIYAAYPILLISADYLVTQANKIFILVLYRLLLIFSVIPVFYLKDQFLVFIYFRSLIVILFVVYLILTVRNFQLFKTDNSVYLIVVTQVFYGGTLFLIPFIASGYGLDLKVWYIGCQIGLVLMLKKIDFQLRAQKEANELVFKGIVLAAFSVPFIVSFYYFDFNLLIIYLISFGMLQTIRLKKV